LTTLIEKFGTLDMLDWQFALKVGVHNAQALEAAHEKHIIHRNLAPESILIRTKDKAAKLAQLDMFLPGDVMLADRLMCTWTEMVMLKQRGVESVCRLRSHHTAAFRRSEP
jgi:serine/threonine protein kinase